MEDKHELTPQESAPLDANAAQPHSDYPDPMEKPPLPPEAMLTPPPRLHPLYKPEQSVTPPAPQSEQSFTPPVQQPAPSFTPPVSQSEHSFTAPIQQPAPSFTPPVSQSEHSFTAPVQQPAPSFTPSVQAPEQSNIPTVQQPDIILAPLDAQPGALPASAVPQPEQSYVPPVSRSEHSLTPPVQIPDQPLTPPAPTIPNQYPKEGFEQPAIAGKPVSAPQYGGPTPPKEPVVYASDYERIMALPPISKEEAESCRHSHEKRWYRRLIELNVLMILSVIILMIVHASDYKEDLNDFSEHIISQTLGDNNEDTDSETDSSDEKDSDEEDTDEKEKSKLEKKREESEYMEEFAKQIPSEIKLFFYGIFGIISLFITLYLNFASIKASSLKITQNNFPEIYSLIHSYAYRLGMKQVPEAYIVQQSGVLNAFSSFIFGRQYILINTEVFEVAYREHKDMNALAFIIAHETSHIYYGHSTLHYNLPILFSASTPIFGQIASRTREYSCDRLAQRLTNYDGVRATMMLIVDRHLYPMVDIQDYVNTTINDRGFFLWLVNMLSSHPIMPKRLRALIQWNGSGELY